MTKPENTSVIYHPLVGSHRLIQRLIRDLYLWPNPAIDCCSFSKFALFLWLTYIGHETTFCVILLKISSKQSRSKFRF